MGLIWSKYTLPPTWYSLPVPANRAGQRHPLPDDQFFGRLGRGEMKQGERTQHGTVQGELKIFSQHGISSILKDADIANERNEKCGHLLKS